jgi:hypothetical protein
LPVARFAAWPHGLSYTDPVSGSGSLRLVLDPTSRPDELALNLVAAGDLTGFATGFDLPVDPSHLALDVLVPGTVLPAGSSPAAAKAVIPGSGPLAKMLVVAQSQKRAGTGAKATDSALHAGDVLLTVKLRPGASAGLAFDGVGSGFRGGLLDHAGNEVVAASAVAIGRLEQH